MGSEMRYNDRYAAKGMPFGPGLDLGRCNSMLLVWSGVISHEVLGSFLVSFVASWLNVDCEKGFGEHTFCQWSLVNWLIVWGSWEY